MKKRMMTLITCALLAAPLAQLANAGNTLFVNDEDRMYLRLCKAVKSNNKLHLHLTLKHEGISYQQMQEGLICNGQDPITFALYSGSKKIAQVIADHTESDVSTILAKN